MLTSPKSHSILLISIIRLNRSFSKSATTHSSILLRTPENGNDNKYPSQKTQNVTTSRGIEASLENFETTHSNESIFCSSFFSRQFKFCTKMGFILEGKQLHSLSLKLGFLEKQYVQTQLLNFYVKCKTFTDACLLFDEIPKRNVVPWNIMICGLVEISHYTQWYVNTSMFYFRKMLVDKVKPDYITFIGLLGNSIELNDIEFGKQLHCFITKLGFNSNHIVGSVLVDFYGKNGLVEDAWKVFDKILSRDLVLWNVMVSCYVLNDFGKKAMEVFDLMRFEGLKGDGFTFSSLLSCCGILKSIHLGKQIHGIIMKLSLDFDVLVSTSLVDMYAKNGNLREARDVFDGMVTVNIVSWTTLIVGYGQNGDGKEAMKLLRKMIQRGFNPDELTLSSILSSSANLAAINEVTQVHNLATKNGSVTFLSIGNALINAYYKCGSVSSASQSFNLIRNPNIFTWTSMICAFSFHGFSKQALEIFDEMLSKGVKPDGVAFLGVLSACSHGGLVNEGLKYFTSMIEEHKIMPDCEHYSSLIDLLGRAGYLKKAYEIIENLPDEPSGDVLCAFLGACKAHGYLELVEMVEEKLLKMEPNESGNYTLLSNIYAYEGSWIEVGRVRKLMRNVCYDNKVVGCSWIEIGGEVHTFVSSDKSHQKTSEIYVVLEMLVRVMKEESVGSY